MQNDSKTDELHNELAAFLAARDNDVARREPCAACTKVRTLKASPHEVTELMRVEAPSAQAELANLEPGTLLVQKKIAAATGLGRAYTALANAQRFGFSSLAVPCVYSVQESNGTLTVLMEYIEGETLTALVAREGASRNLAAALFSPLCKAVEVLHEGLLGTDGLTRPLIHRDLKPSNIIVCDYDATSCAPGRVALIDFGIARAWHEDAVADTIKFGTRSYAPPEQFGFGQTDVRSDIYALGAVLYFCLTGEDPKPGKKATQMVGAADIAEPLSHVIVCAMTLDPDGRFASVRGLRTAFELACRDLEIACNADCGKQMQQQPPLALIRAQQATPPTDFAKHYSTVFRTVQTRAVQSGGASAAQRPQSAVRRVLGIMWNVSLACGSLLLFAATWSAVFEPTGANMHLDTWYLALQYILVVDVPAFLLMLWPLDKSRLNKRFPLLAYARGTIYPLAVIAGAILAFVAVVALGALTGQIQRL